jgi:hypothetical protein
MKFLPVFRITKLRLGQWHCEFKSTVIDVYMSIVNFRILGSIHDADYTTACHSISDPWGVMSVASGRDHL